MSKGKFIDIVQAEKGFLRGPFGSALKKSLFVPKGEDTYKIYEQGVVLQQDKSLGEYHISKQYFNESLKRFEVKSGDFLVSCSGVNYGAIYQLKGEIEKGIINQALLRIRLNHDIVDDNYFVYYFKTYIVKKIIGGTGDSTIPNFPPMSVVKGIDIELPNIEKQRKIGQMLACFDDKVDNNIALIQELESMAKTIYDYWFLQFEFPNKDGKPYKSSGGKMIWNEELKREIPEGWEVGRLNQFIKQDKGGDWGKEFPEGNYIEKVTCLRGADFPAICGAAKLEAPDRFINKKNMFKTLKKGDLIIEISGGSPTQSTGRICYINTNVLNRFKNKLITSNFCKAINLIDEDFMYWFYSLWRKLYDSGVFFLYEGKTTGIKNLLFEMLCRDYPIIIPITDVIKKYNKKIEKLYDEIQQKLLENAELLSLRDFLLPLLMNGQVGFKD